ncbi:hypothetical protein KAI46_10945 [bacterium]|nr:hypothetical protein [bacterium]
MANTSKILILALLGVGILFSPIFMPAAESLAWDVVTGQVSSIFKLGTKVRLTVLLDAQPGKESTKITPAPPNNDSPATTLELEIFSVNLPPRLKTGDYIRIWTHPDNPQTSWRISRSRSHDPTGVRSRLQGRGGQSGRKSGRGGGKGGHGGH